MVFALPLFLIVALLTEEPLGPDHRAHGRSHGLLQLRRSWHRVHRLGALAREVPAGGLLSVFVFPMPLFGVLFSALIFRESISPSLAAGVALVAIGILIVTLEKRVRA
ncbi:MAG: hypothetical protein R2724_11520 [Bryobacterales bacterium]